MREGFQPLEPSYLSEGQPTVHAIGAGTRIFGSGAWWALPFRGVAGTDAALGRCADPPHRRRARVHWKRRTRQVGNELARLRLGSTRAERRRAVRPCFTVRGLDPGPARYTRPVYHDARRAWWRHLGTHRGARAHTPPLASDVVRESARHVVRAKATRRPPMVSCWDMGSRKGERRTEWLSLPRVCRNPRFVQRNVLNPLAIVGIDDVDQAIRRLDYCGVRVRAFSIDEDSRRIPCGPVVGRHRD